MILYNIYITDMSISGRGGSREGSGRPSPWNNKKTVAIRVPECFALKLLDYARRMDQGKELDNLDNVQNQKTLIMLKDALNYPTNSFGKGKTVIKEVISMIENVQNQ